MGEYQVRERAVVQVVAGRVSIESSGETIECDIGTLVTFDRSERHAVHALVDSRLLLVLAPWPAPEHYTEADVGRAQKLPANAAVDPIPASDTAADRGSSKHPES